MTQHALECPNRGKLVARLTKRAVSSCQTCHKLWTQVHVLDGNTDLRGIFVVAHTAARRRRLL